ncbi:DMR6-like oxygenase 2-like protein [Tanacetum coccineum]
MVRLNEDLIRKSPRFFKNSGEHVLDLKGNKITRIENLVATEVSLLMNRSDVHSTNNYYSDRHDIQIRSLDGGDLGLEFRGKSLVLCLKMNSVKALAESPSLNSIPAMYNYSTNSNEPPASDPQEPIPIIDFALLSSTDADLRSKEIGELDKACKDWGFFQVINHGVSDALMKMVIEKSYEFFNMSDEEKKDFEEKDVLDPIRYGTSFNFKKDKVFELLFEYSQRTREVARGLLNGISFSLGLDQSYVEKALEFESGLQIFVVNLYPPCPQPELAIGMPPHSDHGLFTLLINNGVGGLQIKHKGKWVNVNDTLPNSFLVNTADQLEPNINGFDDVAFSLQIFSNGKYRSVEHRAVVNNAVTRISVVMANGPALDTVVRPAYKLVDEEMCPAAYVPMKYKEYLDQYFWLTTLVTAPQTTLKSHTKYLWNIPNFHGAFNESSLEFQRKILERSGLGKETYLPAALHAIPAVPSMTTARQEAEEVMFGSLDNLFKATKINLKDIGILVVNCSLFNPTPSLSSMIVNKYNLL